MEELKTLIESSNGIGAIDNLLTTLADALNVSVQQLQQNLPMYLEQFGAYQLIGNIGFITFASLLVGGLVGILAGLLTYAVIGLATEDEEFAKKIGVTFGIITTIIAPIAIVTLEVIKFKMSPSMYGIMELIRILK